MDVRREAPAASRWHVHPGALPRFVADLIVAEVTSLRPGGAELPPTPWALDLPIGSPGLGLDSLERMSVAAALSQALHLHESGQDDLLLVKRQFGEWLDVIADALLAFDSRITFRTSGSSGSPKACVHLLASLEQEVDVVCDVSGPVKRILSAVPAHHIYGFLFTVLLPARLDVHEVIDIRRLTPQVLGHMLRPGDLVVSHPAHWDLVARHTSFSLETIRGISSTAPCPAELALRLAQRGLTQLLQIYGSSETGGVGWRTSASAPYTLMEFWSRDATQDGGLLRTLPDGSGARHVLQDNIEWLPDGRFHVGPRRDAAVQVGGINVFPARVRDVLLTHPEVVDAAVRLMSPHEGARLKAFVVLRPETNSQTFREQLQGWLSTQVSAVEMPKSITLGDTLPRNDQGKLSDWPIAREIRHDY
ncbi:MAG: AMP-binding protein [Phycisphaerae bacterium]|nr:AMP-binding protein [Gemmatimonadaceae bacterium]